MSSLPIALARALTLIFIAEISRSMSCMNCRIKSTSLCRHMDSRCLFVMRKEIS